MRPPTEPDVQEGEPPGPAAPPGWPLVIALTGFTGALWAWTAMQAGVVGTILGILPAVFLVAPSFSNVFSGGDARISQFMTQGAFFGILLSVPMMFASSFFVGLALLVFSAASFVAAGYLAVGEVPTPAGVPKPEMGPRLSVKAAGDEVKMFALVTSTWPPAIGPVARRIARELDEALEMFEERGWFEDPESFHQAPPPAEIGPGGRFSHRGWDMEYVSFESGYEPWPGEPGRDRWLSHESNLTAHALVLRQPEEGRPWLVCIHGLRNGWPHRSGDLFQPEYLYGELGLNLLYPYLPLHGPRRLGVVNGSPLLAGDVMELLHTGAQAAWDVRRLLGWLELPGQDAPSIGVMGHSLGGYAAALLAGLDDRPDCVISANPSVEPSQMFWRDGFSAATRYLKTNGASQKKTDQLLAAVSPLSFEPKVPREGRAILASVADRIIPSSEPDSLRHHWDAPHMVWHQGTHFGLLQSTEGRETIKEVLRASGVLDR